MIVNHTQSSMRILTRFDEETKLTEITIADKDAAVFPDPVKLDYKEVDQLAKTLDRMSLAYNEAMDREIVVGINGMGMTPQTSPTDPARRDMVFEAVQEFAGERCPEFDIDCATCQTWRQYDLLKEAAPTILMMPRPNNEDDVREGD